MELENGPMVYDASGGAAVRSLGGDIESIRRAMDEQTRNGLTYIPTLGFETDAAADLAEFLIASTNDKLSKVVFYSSGKKYFGFVRMSWRCIDPRRNPSTDF